MTKIEIPELSLVVLVGVSGSGKSTFARRHFLPTEILSSDACRALVDDDESSQAATKDAFDVLHYIAGKRLDRRRLVVVDATNVQSNSRRNLIALARKHHVLPTAIVLRPPLRVAIDRTIARADRHFGEGVVKRQYGQLKRDLRQLKKEGFRRIFTLDSVEAIDSAEVTRVPLWNNKRDEHGPFDIIGDVHGCCDELELLLAQLGYESQSADSSADWSPYPSVWSHPDGRRALFVGDLTDRGPRSVESLALTMNMVAHGSALMVAGNHDVRLLRWLRGKQKNLTHGLDTTVAEFEALPAEHTRDFRRAATDFLNGLIAHYELDNGKLVVAHAGLKESYHGRASGKVRSFALYGDVTGEKDEHGRPIRRPWANEYRGRANVVYGHTVVADAQWLNNTLCIDTGCVFGGKLTALRYPEFEMVEVSAHKLYFEDDGPNPLELAARPMTQQENDDMLDLSDVTGKRIVNTRLRPNITVRAENSATALEVLSRFAVDPHWLIYLPPTMSPPTTSNRDGVLEHPDQAFAFYRKENVAQVVCEEKHMGSRALAIVCQDAEAARERFGVKGNDTGVIYTRTGRRFFEDVALEQTLLGHVRDALSAADFWGRFETSWVLLDCELMPWSAKAQALLREQYAPVGAAGAATLSATNAVLAQAAAAGLPVDALQTEYAQREAQMTAYRTAYRHYCWPVDSVGDLKLAPFHILATEDRVHIDQTHLWHMDEIGKVTSADASGILFRTAYRTVDLNDAASLAEGVAWWEKMTATGGEGMVVKPLEFVATGKKGLSQPAVKVRGKEYLRIIYGPEYDSADNLKRLRERSVSHKRSMAVREFALGIEALERFVRREPLRRVHECVAAVLALESEPVDPRL